LSGWRYSVQCSRESIRTTFRITTAKKK
jgi:hypothetical protein